MDARPHVCARIGVKVYPTWVVGGERYEGVLSLERLAEASRFPGPRGR